MAQAAIKPVELDYTQLNRELDRVKTHVFMGSNAAFLGALMCYLDFVWNENIPTAQVSSSTFEWSPQFFLELKPDTRKTVLMHELWHCALLHMPRIGSRNPEVWNYACDIHINNMLERDGYSFEGIEWCWKDQSFGEQSAEEIYDQLILNHVQPPPMRGAWGNQVPNDQPKGDIDPSASSTDTQTAINNVVQATHAARAAGQPGHIPGEVEQVLKKFLAPIIPWQTLLWRFFTDLLDNDWSWQVRDRRYQDIYLPGEVEDDGRLEHLAYFLDVSGSVTDQQVIRFNSEVKFIKDVLKPKKLTLYQFDTRITSKKVFLEEDPFDELVVVGRGGTDLRPVRAQILEDKPTCAVIFSDLYVAPMEPLPVEIPIIWVAIGNRGAKVPFGDIIYIKG